MLSEDAEEVGDEEERGRRGKERVEKKISMKSLKVQCTNQF